MDGLFEDLEEAVEFDRDQILSQETIDSLEAYANAGLQNINYTEYIIQTRSIISTLNVDEVISDLQNISALFTGIGEVSDQSVVVCINFFKKLFFLLSAYLVYVSYTN